jgi:hypothetical protein
MLLKVQVTKGLKPFTLMFQSPTVRMLNALEGDKLTSNSEVIAKLVELGGGKLVDTKGEEKAIGADDFLDLDLSALSGVQEALSPFLLK